MTDNTLQTLATLEEPALVESFEINVDGKPRKSWGDVIDALGIDIGRAPSSYSSFGKGTVLLPGARSALLSIGRGPGGRIFHRASQPRIHPRICYCSLYEQSWLLDETQDSRPEPVKAWAEPGTPYRQ